MKARYGQVLPLMIASALLLPLSELAWAQGWLPGQSVSWQRARSPFTPGAGAIVGGPGNDPNPGAPMYVCRAQDGGSLVPGKWVGGNCNVAFNNSEDVMQTYEVAYGTARWGGYRGNTRGLIQMGNEPDGSPLYSCRVHYTTNFPPADFGFQPGKLVGDGTCHFPLGGREMVQSAPFEVLYGAGGGYPPYPYPPYPYPQPPPPQLPGCRLVDPGVTLSPDGLWVGPNCTPSDGLGHIPGANNNGNNSNVSQAPPGPYQPGPSSVSWQAAQSPFTPGAGAIVGAGGKGSKPNEPLYVCRAYYNNALLPGKWIGGQCSVSYNGKEWKLDSYEVASGPAEWRNFDGNVSALVPGGYDTDGTPLYVCRAPFRMFGDKGLQPGRLENGKCLYPYAGTEQTSGTPFDALYNVFPAGAAAAQPPNAAVPGDAPPPVDTSAAVQASQGIQVSFVHGPGSTPGTIAVTNGATGKTVTEALPANATPEGCVLILQQAAFKAGLQIQAGADGSGLRVSGINNAVSATGAAIAVSQY